MHQEQMIAKSQLNALGAVNEAPSMTERLEAQQAQLKDQLEKVEAALAALKKSPDVAEAVNAISRLGGYL